MRILLVEDEAIIALHMEDLVADLGHEVAAIAMRLADALDIAQSGEFDFAVLDINLAGAMSFPVADVLMRRGVPFVFATGYGSAGIAPPYDRETIMHKPVRLADLSRAIGSAAH